MLERVFNREWSRRKSGLIEPGRPGLVADFAREEDGVGNEPWVEEVRFRMLLEMLPDKIATNLVKAREARDGKIAMLQAGFGYVDTLNSIIADGVAIASSSAEARLVPAVLLNENYLAPNGYVGRTLRAQLRGRGTTLTTAATLTFRCRGEATDVITGTAWGASGAIVADTTVQTATQWEIECGITVRAIGSGGSVFCQGDCEVAWAALTIANAQNKFIGSAGPATPAAVAKDTTAKTYLNWTAQWSLATAYSIQAHRYMLEALN